MTVKNEIELYHHGIKGMKWYVRRYQNEDGSLTHAGQLRYGKYSSSIEKKAYSDKYYDGNGKLNSRGKRVYGNLGNKADEQIAKDALYYNTKLNKSSLLGTLIGGVPGAVIASAITVRNMNKYQDIMVNMGNMTLEEAEAYFKKKN